jgi:hypothetical protein
LPSNSTKWSLFEKLSYARGWKAVPDHRGLYTDEERNTEDTFERTMKRLTFVVGGNFVIHGRSTCLMSMFMLHAMILVGSAIFSKMHSATGRKRTRSVKQAPLKTVTTRVKWKTITMPRANEQVTTDIDRSFLSGNYAEEEVII